MPQYLVGKFSEIAGRQKHHAATADGERFSKRASPAMSAFDEIAICEDCNTIDAEAKKQVAAPSHFSFSAPDIARFVQARPNWHHLIDRQQLDLVWAKRRPQLDERTILADRLAELAASSDHWYESAPIEFTGRSIEGAAEGHLQIAIPSRYGVNLVDFLGACRPTLSKIPNTKGWRRKRKVAKSPPTTSEIDHLAVSHPGHWGSVSHDWSCPWCNRTKIETVRPSAKNAWSFAVGSERPTYDFRCGWSEPVTVCKDCDKVWLGVAKEAGSNKYSRLVDPDEIIALIDPQPHAEHKLGPDDEIDQVVSRISGNVSRFQDEGHSIDW